VVSVTLSITSINTNQAGKKEEEKTFAERREGGGGVKIRNERKRTDGGGWVSKIPNVRRTELMNV
jgi:hypothetical protein